MCECVCVHSRALRKNTIFKLCFKKGENPGALFCSAHAIFLICSFLGSTESFLLFIYAAQHFPCYTAHNISFLRNIRFFLSARPKICLSWALHNFPLRMIYKLLVPRSRGMLRCWTEYNFSGLLSTRLSQLSDFRKHLCLKKYKLRTLYFWQTMSGKNVYEHFAKLQKKYTCPLATFQTYCGLIRARTGMGILICNIHVRAVMYDLLI